MKKILYVTLLLTSYSGDTHAQLDSVVYKYFSAIGGMEAWGKINSSKEETEIWQNLDTYGLPQGKMTTLDGRDPTLHKSVKKEPWFNYARLIKEGKISMEWYENDRKSGVVKFGMFSESPFLKQWVTIDIALNILHLYNAGKLIFLGEVFADGKPYSVLQGPYYPGGEGYMKFHFSKDIFLLDFVTYGDQPSDVKRYFSDYRDVSGVKVAFKSESYRENILFSRSQILKIEFNPSINDSIFYYHESGESLLTDKFEGKILSDENLDFKQFMESNFKNKRVLIDLWASWCAPCKGEFQYYDSAYYEFMSRRNIDLVFISIDKEEQRKAWEKDMKKYGLKGYHVLAGKKLQKSIRELIYENGEVVIPRYVVVKENGEILSTDFKRPSHVQFKEDFGLLFPER